MRLCEILTQERILVDSDGGFIHDKKDALRLLSHMLAPALNAEQHQVETLLREREALQSTGIGDGVAIPHTAVEGAPGQAAALLLCPQGVPFDAIDGNAVNIIVGVVGPTRATGEHLRALARISRLLRDAEMRNRLVSVPDPAQAYLIIEQQDAQLK